MLIRRILILFLFIFLTLSTQAKSREFVSFNNGQVQFGQSYLDLDLANFKINYLHPNKVIKTGFLEGTLKWEKTSDGLYLPKAELLIQINTEVLKEYQPIVKYNKKTFSPSLLKNNKIYSFSITVSLFEATNIEVYLDDKYFNTIQLKSITAPNVKHHYIDSSCTPYHLEILNFDEYLSVSCELIRLGGIGNERPKVKLSWVTPNYFLIDDKQSSNITTFTSSGDAILVLKNHEGEKKNIQFKVSLPKKLNRVKTALGIGPYSMLSQYEDKKEEGLTGNITLYGKLEFTTNSSLRFFNSFAMKKNDYFNNFGLYFAYDLARVYDDRIQIVALLGMQYLTHKIELGPSLNEMIAPQGGEITFHHPFGLHNYVLGAGGFYTTFDESEYINTWLRFGKNTTYEVNFIKYRDGNREVSVTGFCLIFPLFSFL